MKLSKILLLNICAFSLCIGSMTSSRGSGMLAEMAPPPMMRMMRQYTPSRIMTSIGVAKFGYRCQSTTTNLYPKGIYTQATEDPIFKYLMHDDEVRNSFLTGVIGERVVSSELLDSSLNPMRSYTAIRELFNRPEIKTLMEEVASGTKEIEVRNKKTNYPLKQYARFLNELSPLYHELLQAIPDRERNTQLDLVCETDTGLVNVEVQVEPQDFWDIRILDHACGLFHRQFAKGFQWSQLESDRDIHNKVKRVIGVSIFEKPPVSPESVHSLLPWYQLHAWKHDELRRNYQLLETKDPQKKRAGLEFYDYNLAALQYVSESAVIQEGGEVLKEWLDLLANAHLKTKEDSDKVAKLPQVKKAYRMLESGSLPEQVKKQYEEAQKKRFQISHYVKDREKKAEKAAKTEVARKMLARKRPLNEIAEDTGLSKEEIKSIK